MKKHLKQSQAGFSLVETLVAIAITFVVMAIAIVRWTTLLPNARANAAMDMVVYRLRSAREQAIAHRRQVQVQFVGTNQITISELWLAGTPPPPQTYTFEDNTVFMTFNSVPDTPMAFGNGSAIYFEGLSGGPPTMTFTTTGAFVDGSNNYVNGTVFLGIAGDTNSARAVTVLGATGRVREYHWDGSQWQE